MIKYERKSTVRRNEMTNEDYGTDTRIYGI